VLATLFGDGRDTRIGAQGIVISFGKSSAGLSDDCGCYDSPDSRQRAEDRNVAVLPWVVVLLLTPLCVNEK
jgi:hypothetical protein